MDLSDKELICNRDWDPSYLAMLFNEDFNEFPNLWSSNIDDRDLVHAAEKLEIYSPIVEDISMDDSTLCKTVEEIEDQ